MKRRPIQVQLISAEPSSQIDEYRNVLLAAEQKSQEAFDKTVLSLSGGALGVSFAFLKDIIGEHSIDHLSWLVFAWICWAASSIAVLASFYWSQLALRRAVRQVDTGKIYEERPGGLFSKVIVCLNPLGGIMFFVGVIAMTGFVQKNLSIREVGHDRQEAGSTVPAKSVTESSAAIPKTGACP